MNNPYTMHEEFDKQSGQIKELSDLYAYALQKADKWDALVEKCAGVKPDELVQSRQFWMETARERMQAVNGMHVTIENQQTEIKNLRCLRDEQGQQLKDVNEEFAKQSQYIEELEDKLKGAQEEVGSLYKRVWRSNSITDVDAIEQRLSVVERRLDAHGC